jgi:hypothetical protein
MRMSLVELSGGVSRRRYGDDGCKQSSMRCTLDDMHAICIDGGMARIGYMFTQE